MPPAVMVRVGASAYEVTTGSLLMVLMEVLLVVSALSEYTQ
jgi:hypothetical protein